MVDEMKCEYCGIGGYGKLIKENDYWQIFLAPSQRYLGTCVIGLKRHCSSLAELEDVEWAEFSRIVREMEFVLADTFKPTLFNWSCFKNAAFRVENPNPEVHWHLIPRYKYEVEYQGIKFEDPDFGYIPQPVNRGIPEEIMEAMIKEIKARLKLLQ
jgi:diadenosine tetraphosphate (Ap4A) HIT family hydrolase